MSDDWRFDDETPEEETGPDARGRFSFLRDAIESLRDSFNIWRAGADQQGGIVGTGNSWADVGRDIDASRRAFIDAESEFFDEDEEYAGWEEGFSSGLGEHWADVVVYDQPADKDARRKTFASPVDVTEYLSNVLHLLYEVYYDHQTGLFTVYIYGS